MFLYYYSNCNKKFLSIYNRFIFFSKCFCSKVSNDNDGKTKIFYPKRLIRNIGLVAHIDAGKTTTTERILFYSGQIDNIGEVHNGDTVMDHMEQERERGITITMAAATIPWNGFNINLIDTPGHVDFQFEVERSLSILDGSIVILDGSVGVQAQTIKVWNQVCRNKIPSIFFLNKMDKPTASISKSLMTIENKLYTNPLLLQSAIFNDMNEFIGLIDLIDETYLEWSYYNHKDKKYRGIFRKQSLSNKEYFNEDNEKKFLDKNTELKYKEKLQSDRENLIMKICDYDDQLANNVLQLDHLDSIDKKLLINSIRQLCLKRKLFPVLIGSSYRNIGIQPLLDSICYYLPGPFENENNRILFENYTQNNSINNRPISSMENLCSLAFKIHHHKRLGSLTYLRLYSGCLLPSKNVFNINRDCLEKINKIYRPFADKFLEIDYDKEKIEFGDIVAVSGLNQTITGDTIVHPNNQSSEKSSLLAGIEIPDPVYYCSLECQSISKMKQLEIALERLQREDPSLRVSNDRNSQQLIIKGMGQLHIEIIKERIRREYGVDVETGPLQISYKETITNECHAKLEQSKTIGGQLNYVKVMLSVKPENDFLIEQLSSGQLSNEILNDSNSYEKKIEGKSQKFSSNKINSLLKIVNTKENNLSSQLKPWQLKAIKSGIQKALDYGPLYSFPIVGVQIFLEEFSTTKQTSMPFISNVVSNCILTAIRNNGRPILMEPIMKVEIICPEKYLGPIISDLAQRRSQLIQTDHHYNHHNNDNDDDLSTLFENNNNNHQQNRETGECRIVAYVPLSEMENYSTILRTISSGMASLDMILDCYRPVDEQRTEQIIKTMSGIQ